MICSQCLSYSGTHVNGQASVFWSNQVQEAGLTHSGLGRTPSCHADSYFFLNLRGNGSGAPKEEMFRERMSPPHPILKASKPPLVVGEMCHLKMRSSSMPALSLHSVHWTEVLAPEHLESETPHCIHRSLDCFLN